jgi:hypothetical protein
MKKRVNGHVFDTKHATLVGVVRDESISTAVFKTKSGEFFVLKYAGGDARNPELGAIGASSQQEAEAIAARPGFVWSATDAFDNRETVRTSMELTVRDRDLLRHLCCVSLDGSKRKRRIGMGEAVGELLEFARTQIGFGETEGMDAVAGSSAEEKGSRP